METFSEGLTCALRGWEVFPLERGLSWGLLALLYILVSVTLLRRRNEERVWLATGLMLLVLTLGRVFDLQALLTGTARCMVQQEGLYRFRRPMQALAVVTLLMAGALALPVLLRSFAAHRMLVAALGILVLFIAVRSLSFHPIDAALAIRLGELPLARLIEAAALLPILYAALRR